jgi:hypothetical protein
MKRFEDVMSPLSWLCVVVGLIPMFVFVLHPTLLELFVFCAVDYAALILMKKVDRALFPKIFPDCALYFWEENLPKIANCTHAEKLALFQSLLRFPGRRALYCWAMSFVKAIPAMWVVIFYWKHTLPYSIQFVEIVCMLGAMYSFFYGAAFIENHILTSAKIAELHRKYDWSDVFRTWKPQPALKPFERQETISFVMVAVFLLNLQWYLVSHPSNGSYSLGAQILSVGFAGLIYIFWIWCLRRQFYLSSLTTLFEALESLNLQNLSSTMALNSFPAVAHFQSVFNSLVDRLRS